MSQPKVANPPCRLYLISPPSIDLDLFAAELAAALAAGDVACFQLRLKDATDDQIRAAAEALIPICHDRDVAFILNDRPDLAATIGADGVHIGQQDTDYATARTLLGADKIVGVTCHDSRHLAMLAGEAGADYVAFGAFYDTSTKAPKTRADPEILEWWSTFMEIPCVAIGGITIENCGAIIKTGADFIAVSSGVWDCGTGPGAAVKEFNQILGQSATTETT